MDISFLMDIFQSNMFCMDISFPMDIFLYGHYSIWTFYLMDNLQIHHQISLTFLTVWNLKKGPQYGLQKQGAKNIFIVIQKGKRQPGHLSFWITMTLFLHPAFCNQYFGLFVQGLKQTHEQEMWVQIDWETDYWNKSIGVIFSNYNMWLDFKT